MSNDKDKGEKSYIKVIDDTTTEDYLKYQNSTDILGYFFLFGLFVMPIVGIIGVATNSVVAAILSLVVAVVVVVYLYSRSKKKRLNEWEKSDKNRITKQVINKSKLAELKDLLSRIDYVSFSCCDGFVMSPSQMAKTQVVPLYGIATNPAVYKYEFIRVKCDLKYISKKDRELLLEVFERKKDDSIIWFSQKDVAKWAALSNVQVINFVDKDGKKMCFGHTRYSAFYNHRRLEIEDGECIIRITDKRQSNSKEPPVNEQSDEQFDDEEDYYDDDI